MDGTTGDAFLHDDNPNKLTRQKRLFVMYLIEQDFQQAYKAYMRASPKCQSEHAARVYTARLLRDPGVKAEVSRVLSQVLADRRIPIEKRVVDFWVKRAFYDPTEIVGLDGTVKLTEAELRERHLDQVIDGIVRKSTPNGWQVEVRFADRDKAAEMLSEYAQLIKRPGVLGDLPPGTSINVTLPSNGRESG